ncbi:glycosyltransferase family 2 protein [Pedobacter riviphilus]|uniref:Glycosyltransferase family 2 protein n=1 Tax=Pedobacter riviphilus TaxID=2766984 RepID=A0ABX6TG21_9SPHI|nr:glycosyltransferase family 2 protein [Pedobacter riviphilus]QNR83908.1 glycosyltransferase family 2 protein [Pedobacter riviphilus]
MIKIAIVIPVYNRKDVTIAGLTNIYSAIGSYVSDKNRISFDVIVVDDGSTDGTANWIHEHIPGINVLTGTGNLWWSGSINLGAKYAIENLKASHILLWNDDTVCEKNYFFNLEKLLLSDSKYLESILVSKVFWLHDKDRLFNFGAYYESKTGRKVLIGLNQYDVYDEVIPVDWSGGMGTLIPAEVMLALDYFDDVNFPQYHGDIDFFLRAKKIGFKSYGIPCLKVYNNAETTGIVGANKLRDLVPLLNSNRSLHNFKQNYAFNKRHSNTFVSWCTLAKSYLAVFVKTLIKKKKRASSSWIDSE